jgi:hypothetical protein
MGGGAAAQKEASHFDKAFEHHANRDVHIIVSHVIPEVHFRMGLTTERAPRERSAAMRPMSADLSHAHDGLDVSHGDGHTPRVCALFAQIRVESGQLVFVDSSELTRKPRVTHCSATDRRAHLRVDVLARVSDVFLEQFLRNGVSVIARLFGGVRLRLLLRVE